VLDLKPWEQHLDVPGWPGSDLGTICGGWCQRTDAHDQLGLLQQLRVVSSMAAT
jgi:hypothetical protein